MSNLNKRADFAAIANWIAPNTQVLDLGCGDGSFLEFLQKQKPVHTYGVEIDDARVLSCVQKGLNVIQQNLEGGLALFEDNSFDMVVLSQTLQTIHQTARILSEIARVGKECVVSFPNFGHWSHRAAVALGRMPVSKSLPYQWYDTPNIRVGTFADFAALATKNKLQVLDAFGLQDGQEVRWLPNLLAGTAVFKFEA